MSTPVTREPRGRISSLPVDLSARALIAQLRDPQRAKRFMPLPVPPSPGKTIRVCVESRIGSIPGREIVDVSTNDRVCSIISKFLASYGRSSNPNFIIRDINGLSLRKTRTVQKAGILDGDILFLSTPESEPKVFSYTSWGKIALLCAALCLCFLGGSLTAYMANKPRSSVYSIILDAGSVHTSAYMYRFKEKRSGTGLVEQVLSCNIGTVGISSFQSQPEQVRDYINSTCFRNSTEMIKLHAHADAPVVLAGTAGMRDLRLMDPEGAQWIIGNLSQQMEKHLVNKHFRVEIISGEKEGLNGWVTTNYLTRSFKGLQDGSTVLPAANSSGTYGVLDWGGASVQITVEVPQTDANYDVTLYGKRYHVYTASHLCYGQKMATFRQRALLYFDKYQTTNGSLPTRVLDSCAPLGSQVEQRIQGLFGYACTQLHDTGFMNQVRNLNGTVVFMGTGDYEDCRLRAEKAFDLKECTNRFQQYATDLVCFDSSTIRRPTATPFYAFTSYWFMTSALGLPSAHSFASFENKTVEICSKTRSELILSGIEEFVVDSICFKALFMQAMLFKGYHFDTSTYEQIQFVKNVAGTEFSWTIGHMILISNNISPIGPVIYLSDMMFVVMLATAFGFSVLFIFFAYQGRKFQTREKYQRLAAS